LEFGHFFVRAGGNEKLKKSIKKTTNFYKLVVVEDIAPLLWNLLKFNEIKNNYIVDYQIIK